MEKVRSSDPRVLAAYEAMRVESSPPLRNAPTGTSLKRCSFTVSARSASIRSSVSDSEYAHFGP
jgi:hypothetical protein